MLGARQCGVADHAVLGDGMHSVAEDRCAQLGRMLTRDARQHERKKYGQKGARKRFQFTKR